MSVDSLILTNELFKYSADTLECKFQTIPGWLKFRQGKRYHKDLKLTACLCDVDSTVLLKHFEYS